MLALHLPNGPLHVVALGAHPDDVEIGCGGLLMHLARRSGITATQVVLTGEGTRLAETQRAFAAFMPGVDTSVASLGLRDGRVPAAWADMKQGLEEAAQAHQADIVLAPRLDDSHQDHRLLAEAVTTVWRDCLVMRYEIPKWDGDLAAASHYLPLSETDARAKVDRLNENYVSQRARDWWDDLTFLGLMRLRGLECRAPFAEGFVIAKATLDLGG